MKKILFLLIFAPFLSFGQYKYIVIDNGEVKFDRVYEVPGKNADQIFAMLNDFIPRIQGVTEYRDNQGSISAKMIDARYDSSILKDLNETVPASYKNHAFNNHIVILVKDEKYRVIVSNFIYPRTGMGVVDAFNTLAKGKGEKMEFKPAGLWVKTGRFYETYLSEMFKIREIKPDTNW